MGIIVSYLSLQFKVKRGALIRRMSLNMARMRVKGAATKRGRGKAV
jgi:hypothetical protein